MAPAHHFMLDTIPIDIDGPSNFNILAGLFHQFVLAMTLGVLYHLIPLQKVLDLPSTDGVQIYLPLYKTMRSQQNRWDESFLIPFELIDRSYHEPGQQLSLRVNLSLSKKILSEQLTCKCLHQRHKDRYCPMVLHPCPSSHLKLLYFELKHTQNEQLHQYQHLENQCRIIV